MLKKTSETMCNVRVESNLRVEISLLFMWTELEEVYRDHIAFPCFFACSLHHVVVAIPEAS